MGLIRHNLVDKIVALISKYNIENFDITSSDESTVIKFKIVSRHGEITVYNDCLIDLIVYTRSTSIRRVANLGKVEYQAFADMFGSIFGVT